MLCLREWFCSFFDYETPVVVRTKAIRVAIFHRLIQLFIAMFIFVYSIGYLKGYQVTSNSITSTLSSQVKGELHKEFVDMIYKDAFLLYSGFDPDAYFPGAPTSFQGHEKFMLPTSVELLQQTVKNCSEDPTVIGAKCSLKKNPCEAGKRLVNGNGVMTGRCVRVLMGGKKTKERTCEITGWCPVDSKLTPVLDMDDEDAFGSMLDDLFSDVREELQESFNQMIMGLETNVTTNATVVDEVGEEEEDDEDYLGFFDAVMLPILNSFHRMQLWKDAPNIDLIFKSIAYFPVFDETRYERVASWVLIHRTALWKFMHVFIDTSNTRVYSTLKYIINFGWPPVYSILEDRRSWRPSTIGILAFYQHYGDVRMNYDDTVIDQCWNQSVIDISKCPSFTLKEILRSIAKDHGKRTMKELLTEGGLISVTITWECNFDWNPSESCKASHKFKRVGNSHLDIGKKTWYIGDDTKHVNVNVTSRSVVRISSIKFVVKTEAKCGKFSPVQFFYRLGAGAGLFQIATLICEHILLNTSWFIKKHVVSLKYVDPTMKRDKQVPVLEVNSEAPC